MFDFENENNNKGDIFENYDLEMKEINNLYNECQILYIENENIKKKENDIYIIYIMFNVVVYMLIVGSYIKNTLNHNYLNTLFSKQININTYNSVDSVDSLD
jgi:hypothetical protein